MTNEHRSQSRAYALLSQPRYFFGNFQFDLGSDRRTVQDSGENLWHDGTPKIHGKTGNKGPREQGTKVVSKVSNFDPPFPALLVPLVPRTLPYSTGTGGIIGGRTGVG